MYAVELFTTWALWSPDGLFPLTCRRSWRAWWRLQWTAGIWDRSLGRRPITQTPPWRHTPCCPCSSTPSTGQSRLPSDLQEAEDQTEISVINSLTRPPIIHFIFFRQILILCWSILVYCYWSNCCTSVLLKQWTHIHQLIDSYFENYLLGIIYIISFTCQPSHRFLIFVNRRVTFENSIRKQKNNDLFVLALMLH